MSHFTVKLWLIQRRLGGRGQRALTHGRGTPCMWHASFTPSSTPIHTLLCHAHGNRRVVGVGRHGSGPEACRGFFCGPVDLVDKTGPGFSLFLVDMALSHTPVVYTTACYDKVFRGASAPAISYTTSPSTSYSGVASEVRP